MAKHSLLEEEPKESAAEAKPAAETKPAAAEPTAEKPSAVPPAPASEEKAATEEPAAEEKPEEEEKEKSQEESPTTGKRSASPFYNADEWRLMLWIFGIGVVGGAVAKVLELPTVQNVSLLSATLYGGIAALLAVFFLARTDTDKRIHLTIFALLCGFVGSPLVQKAVGNFGEGFGVSNPVGAAQGASTLVASALASPPNAAGKKVEEAGSKLTTALQNVDTQQPKVQTEVIASVERTVDSLQAVAPAAPDQTLQTIQNVGVTAKQTGQLDVAERALRITRDLTGDPKTSAAAARALDVLNRVLDIKPRIYLELGGAWPDADIDRLKKAFEKAGYPIANVARVTGISPQTARVRYYDQADANEAEFIAEKLKESVIESIKPAAFLEKKPADFRPRHFDVELSSGSLPPSP